MPEVNEQNKNAMGGTELMAQRIEAAIEPELLEKFQIIHSRVRELQEDKHKILVCHDLPQDPEVQHLKDEGWKKFDKLVFVSDWQQAMYQAYLGVPYSAGVVMRNAIEPIQLTTKPGDKLRFIYHTTPHRGLDILYVVFDQLTKEYDNLELNVFSSFDLYGWESRDEKYKDLFKALEDHPNINYSKSVSNEQIREELARSHVFAYPSKWTETSCLSLIEAMSAGCACVHSSLGALPETSMGMTFQYTFSEDMQQHTNRFYTQMKDTIELYLEEDSQRLLEHRLSNAKMNADRRYNMKLRSIEWNNLLEAILTDKQKFDTVESNQ